MLDDIQQICGSRLGPGTLYGAIARLEQQGWIEPLPAEDRRKPYRLTGSSPSAPQGWRGADDVPPSSLADSALSSRLAGSLRR
jgi:hypothetical protein